VSAVDIPLRGRISSAARFPRRFFIRGGKIARCHEATALVRHELLTDKPPLEVRSAVRHYGRNNWANAISAGYRW